MGRREQQGRSPTPSPIGDEVSEEKDAPLRTDSRGRVIDAARRLSDGLDAELHRGILRADRRAFEELYRRYAASSFGLALKVTGQRALAEEVTHDAFLALWRAPEAFDPSQAPFRAFFMGLVHHRAVDAVRREDRLRRRAERVNPSPSQDEDVADEVVEEAWLRERRVQVIRALGRLPAEQREAIELAYFRGYTQRQVAEKQGVPLGTVKTRTLAGMRKLRHFLTEGDG